MTGFTIQSGVLHADQIPLPDLAAQYGTPLYVYSAETMRNNVKRLRCALEKALPADRMPLIAFACKANSNLSVLKLLQSMGLGCDIVSGGEMTRALQAGIPAHKIVYSGVGKSDEELSAAIDHDILQINVESKAELERIAEIAADKNAQPRVCFRLNPDVSANVHEKNTTGRRGDKFGLLREELEPLYEWASQHPHIQPYGLQMHIGSQLTDITPFKAAYQKLADAALSIQERGFPLHNLDLGGGLGIIYKDETPPDLDQYATLIKDTILPLGTHITLEPGRFLAGDAGILLSAVGYIKDHDGIRHVILDAGMNDLIRPALYDGYHAVRPVCEKQNAPVKKYDVVGPVCETGDTFMKNCETAELEKGDLVALMNAGAYGFVMASNYNTRPLPAEVLVDGDKYALIRHRQTVQDILDKEQIPDWL